MPSPRMVPEPTPEDPGSAATPAATANKTACSITASAATSVPAQSPHGKQTYLDRWSSVARENRGLLLLCVAMFFSSTMAAATRLLETDSPPLHALQILFARQSITTLGCLMWMWYHRTPSAPFGPRGVRLLLVTRGLGGFWGVFGIYYSLTYLDLSDAMVITFLAPVVTAYACSVIPALKEPFTRGEAVAAVVSFTGVVLIARPASLFGGEGGEPEGGKDGVTPHQRLMAVLVAIVGVFGAATAYTSIRWIGSRAHPLVSVFYFSTWCAIVSAIGLLAIPSIGGVVWPANAQQWGLLCGIGVSGFVMQFLLTTGLQLEKAGRGTNMLYLQMVFALIWERIIWGTVPGWWSLAGGAMILGSAVWVGVVRGKKKKVVKEEVPKKTTDALPAADEETGLLAAERE